MPDFFGLECFRGGKSLSEQLTHLRDCLTQLIDSGCRNGDHLRCELMNFEIAMVAPITQARRLEEQLEALKPRMPKWMRFNTRGGV